MKKWAYYNDVDEYVCAWVRNLMAAGLVAPGEVDCRPIELVSADDVRGFAQCHWFCGVAGWSLALRLAGWPDDRPVWTGSCPCQPHSSAARGRNVAADLWPEWRRFVSECRPIVVFGEQVDEARAWMDCVSADLEAMGYAVRARVLPAYSVGEDHARERIYFAGHANGEGKSSGAVNGQMGRLPRDSGVGRGVVLEDGLPVRMAVLRAFGNAIVPELAAQFIRAHMMEYA